MTPEQDPAVCQALEDAARNIADQARNPWMHPGAAKQDRGAVPPRLIARFSGLARRYGYTTRRVDMIAKYGPERGAGLLGCTAGPAFPQDPCTVELRRGMSRASEARVLGHECAHIILDHTGMTMRSSVRALTKMLITGGAEDIREEAEAELAAGAFCQVAGIGTGRFSPQFICDRFGGQAIPEETIMGGVLGARILWAAARPALEGKAA